jgi:hypothetical protein
MEKSAGRVHWAKVDSAQTFADVARRFTTGGLSGRGQQSRETRQDRVILRQDPPELALTFQQISEETRLAQKLPSNRCGLVQVCDARHRKGMPEALIYNGDQ